MQIRIFDSAPGSAIAFLHSPADSFHGVEHTRRRRACTAAVSPHVTRFCGASPEGAPDDSPAFQRWVPGGNSSSPVGTTDHLCQPEFGPARVSAVPTGLTQLALLTHH